MNYSEQEILDICFPIEEEKIGISMILDDILKDLEPEYYDDNVIYWRKNGKTYFEQNIKFKILYCDYHLVWKVFSNKKNYNYWETQELIKNLLDTTEEWKDYDSTWM